MIEDYMFILGVISWILITPLFGVLVGKLFDLLPENKNMIDYYALGLLGESIIAVIFMAAYILQVFIIAMTNIQ